MSVLSKPSFHDETAPYAFLERLVWPNGPTCPHCGNADAEKIGQLKGKTTPPGLKKCYECRKQFTVKVGTVYESSHVPLHKWLQATFLLKQQERLQSPPAAPRVGSDLQDGLVHGPPHPRGHARGPADGRRGSDRRGRRDVHRQ